MSSNTDHASEQFSAYLNRHLTGIIHFKDRIEKILVYPTNSESFGIHACRFYIDIKVKEDKYSKEDKELLNRYFFNAGNQTGHKFVSFIYKSRNDSEIDLRMVDLFIRHFNLAKSKFDDIIKNVLPETCKIEFEGLESEPFFKQVTDFIEPRKNQSWETLNQLYKQERSREFFESIKSRHTPPKPPPAKPANDIKKQEEKKKEEINKKLIEEFKGEKGDYIFIEKDQSGAECKEIGIIKNVPAKSIDVEYIILNKDLSPSRLASKTIAATNISYFIKSSVFQKEKSKGIIREKAQVFRLFKSFGVKNSIFSAD